MRRFEYVDDKSSKFWQITLDGSEFTVQYGRIGTDGQTQIKTWPTADKAKAEHDKLVKEKTSKGYVEVSDGVSDGASNGSGDDVAEVATSSAVDGAAGAGLASATTPAARTAPPKAAPKPKKAPAAAAAENVTVLLGQDGWLDAGGGYALGIRDGAVVARNDKGKVLSSLPKQVKDTELLETLEGALEFLVLHRAECKEAVETWMLRSLPVPRTILQAVWADPDWQTPLANLVVDAGGTVGILKAVEDRGLGVVDLDGETRWLAADAVHIPHPILLGDLDDWRSLLAELGISQGTAQLFRETFLEPADSKDASIDEFSGGEFAMLAQVNNEARKQGYRVSGGCAVCRVWEGGQLVEARYYIGDGDPMYETSTGDLSWVDARQRGLTIAEVGPVAFSEGMRMASGLYAKRKIEEKEEEEDV